MAEYGWRKLLGLRSHVAGRKEQEQKGKTTLFGVNSMRPQVVYRAAHVAGMALT